MTRDHYQLNFIPAFKYCKLSCLIIIAAIGLSSLINIINKFITFSTNSSLNCKQFEGTMILFYKITSMKKMRRVLRMNNIITKIIHNRTLNCPSIIKSFFSLSNMQNAVNIYERFIEKAYTNIMTPNVTIMFNISFSALVTNSQADARVSTKIQAYKEWQIALDYNIMNSKVVITLLINFMLLISMYLLYQLITRDASQNDQSSRKRFLFLLANHFFLFFSMFLLTSLATVYDFMLWTFVNLLTVASSMFVCEQIVQSICRDPFYDYTRFSYDNQRIEVTYLNIYFLAYMYALIGLLPSSVFMIITEGLICYQQIQINCGLSRCLRAANMEQQQNGECPICLFDLKDGKKCMEIKSCGHLFHEDCLFSWIRYRNTCPLDRKTIFLQNYHVQDVFGQ